MKILLTVCAAAAAIASSAGAAVFYPIVSATSSTGGSDLWPASNLIQGPGAGYDAAEPHGQLGTGSTHRWVTDAPGGFPSDYIAIAGPPVITFDLGANVSLSEISVWAYTATNSNGIAQFSLRFATAAEGPGGFSTSITYNPSFGAPANTPGAIPLDDITRNSFTFSQTVSARYVEFTALDNWFWPPGNGTGGVVAGGDRVGMGEVAFAQIPEPSAVLLGGVALLGMLRRRA